MAKAKKAPAKRNEKAPGIKGALHEVKKVGAANTDEPVLQILEDKSMKAKAKVSAIGQLLISGKISIDSLVDTAKKEADVNKGTLLESMEYASKIKADILNENGFKFAVESVKSDAPRVKWESAKIIANTAHLFPKLLKDAVANLLNNTEHPGNVVRWSAAGALSKIIQCKTSLNKELLPTIETLVKNEEDNAVKKIYQQALKKGS